MASYLDFTTVIQQICGSLYTEIQLCEKCKHHIGKIGTKFKLSCVKLEDKKQYLGHEIFLSGNELGGNDPRHKGDCSAEYSKISSEFLKLQNRDIGASKISTLFKQETKQLITENPYICMYVRIKCS